jgi:hypothetical protein
MGGAGNLFISAAILKKNISISALSRKIMGNALLDCEQACPFLYNAPMFWFNLLQCIGNASKKIR